VQALDEWKVRDDLILVLGFDYSRFVGAGEDFSLTPRIGAQFDLNAKTRIRSAFTAAPSEEKNWREPSNSKARPLLSPSRFQWKILPSKTGDRR
jgi:hypothetical protein